MKLPGFLIINTIPKSGTYLVSMLLRKMGLHDSGLHFRNDRYWDFNNKPISEIIAEPNQYMTPLSLDQSFKLVGHGQFCVAHLNHDENAISQLKTFHVNHIFLVRNIRDCLMSHMRFISDPRRRGVLPAWAELTDEKKRMLEYLKKSATGYIKEVSKQAIWLTDRDQKSIRFEILLGDNGPDEQLYLLEKIIDLVGVNFNPETAQQLLMNEVIGKPTRTFSGTRSLLKDYWSDEAEEFFTSINGPSLNACLGYPQNTYPN